MERPRRTVLVKNQRASKPPTKILALLSFAQKTVTGIAIFASLVVLFLNLRQLELG
jgi:hypothetical protein